MLLIYNYNMFYVYVDWTTEDSPRPFYVGKGNISRTRKGKRPAACDLNVGKKRTDESKAKLSEKAKEREAKKRMERQQRLHPHEEQVTQPSL
jgi:hypothetical protein